MTFSPKTKLLYGFSNIRSTQQFECLLLSLDERFDLRVLFYGARQSLFPQVLEDMGLDVQVIPFVNGYDLPLAIVSTLWLLIRWRPAIVHAHLRIATRILIPLACLFAIPRRIHTRHHSIFHHRHHKKGVLVDRLVNSLSTEIVAPSALIRRVLVSLEQVNPAKISVIHHWFDSESYQHPSGDALKDPLDLTYPIILMNARFENLKGHAFAIRAFRRLLHLYPHAKLRFANSTGHDSGEVLALLETLLPPHSWELVPFSNHIHELYQGVDFFIHCPIDRLCESFGQVYIEAMAAGIPCIFTRSGIGLECLEHLQNCWIVPHKSSRAIYEALVQLSTSSELRASITQGARSTSLHFTYSKHLSQLLLLYTMN